MHRFAFVLAASLVAPCAFAQSAPDAAMRIGTPAVAPAAPPLVALAPLGHGALLMVDAPAGARALVALVPRGDPPPMFDDALWQCTAPCALYVAPGRYRAVSRIGTRAPVVTRLTVPARGGRATVRPPSDPATGTILTVTGAVLLGASSIGLALLGMGSECTGDCGWLLPTAVGALAGHVAGVASLAVGMALGRAARGGMVLAPGEPRIGWAVLPRRDGATLGVGVTF